jgi:teichuronic acid biosynthesis glycosyltransferase TuaC
VKVLCLTNMYPTEADPLVGSFVRDLVQDLLTLGVDVDVLAFDGRRRKRAYAEAGLELRRALRRGPFDLVHAHYGLTGAVAVSQGRVPVVVTFHGSDTGSPYAPWQAWISWFVARMATPVFVSKDATQRLGRTDAAVIPAGVDIEMFQPRPAAEAREALGWAKTGRYVLLPGARANPVKGAPLFDATVLKLQARMTDVVPVSLEGFSRQKVADVMNAVDVTLMTSDFEGSPVSIKESLACTTPVVSVPVGDVPELLAGLPGCAIAPRDPVVLAEAAMRAIERGGDSKLRTRAEGVSRRRVAERTVALYESVLAKPASARRPAIRRRSWSGGRRAGSP